MASEATAYLKNSQYRKAGESYEKVISYAGDESGYIERYNAACSWALANEPDKAFKQLFYLASTRKKDPKGYMSLEQVSNMLTYFTDEDLQSIRNDDRWNEFRVRLQKGRKPIVNTLDSIYLDDQLQRVHLSQMERNTSLDAEAERIAWIKIHKADSVNLAKVEQIIKKYGWLSADSVGKRGNMTLFLVIQHSDLKTQKKYLPLMRAAVQNKNARPADLALLEDRIAIAERKKQVYGSQVAKNTDGTYYLLPLDNPDSVDILRQKIGLGPLKYYLKNWKIDWDPKTYKNTNHDIKKENSTN